LTVPSNNRVTTFLGGGVGYRRAHRAALLGPGPGPDVLEIMPEHFYARPGDIDALAERYPLVFHCVGLSVGTAAANPAGDAVTLAQLPRLRELVRRARPLLVSDHLAFTRSPGGIDLGHLAPLPRTDASYALVAARVRLWQDVLNVPIALENIAHPFEWPGPGPGMTEAAFFHRLHADTGCGLLLDVTNLLYDARNFGGEPRALLAEYPREAVAALHLAGGVLGRDRCWTDTHDHPVDEDAFALLPELRGCPALRAAIVERDDSLPALDVLAAEARRAAAILRGA
jgi:uncharacterized protein (UPF0276 family)